MKQPELGKKIAELRKAKGLTQEELVEKCNINVRTLQRIEAGEATPRSYTVKIIFAALDCSIYESSESTTDKFMKIEHNVSLWLGQLYKYVIDLCNLKTNTMKKITILSVPFLTICTVLVFSFNSYAKAQSKAAIKARFEIASAQPKFIQWFNAGQIDSVSLGYDINACMVPSNSPALNNRENIKDYYRQLYNSGVKFANVRSVSKIISDTLAIDRGVWTISVNSVPVASGAYMTQWHYVHGEWLIENEITNTDK